MILVHYTQQTSIPSRRVKEPKGQNALLELFLSRTLRANTPRQNAIIEVADGAFSL